MKTAEEFVKEHEESFTYFKEVSDPEIYQFYLFVIAVLAEEYAEQFKPKWIDIKAHKPPIDMIIAGYWHLNEFIQLVIFWDNINPANKHFTHWQPLPTAP